jgi:hypothetical protein
MDVPFLRAMVAVEGEEAGKVLPSDSNAISGEVDADHVLGEEVVPNEAVESRQGNTDRRASIVSTVAHLNRPAIAPHWRTRC